MATRYVAELLDSQGYARMGSSGVMIGTYKSDKNALRYMPIRLKNGFCPAGQYQVLKIDRNPEVLVGHIYKLVD